MKVSKAQVAENRESILHQAGRLFRQKGFDGVAVAELMGAAGLTNGAFYGHFASKDDLAAEVCKRVLVSDGDPWARLSGEDLRQFIDDYLSPRHLRHREAGCLYAALAGDVVRQPATVRSAFTQNLRTRLEALGRVVTGRSREVRRQKALATMATMVGALTLARAVCDPELSAELLDAARATLA
jgi:TetR/AcrR family transcriptional repressor of nem operon